MTSSAELLFADLSSNNGAVDLAAYAKAGHERIALKATENTDYTWDAHASLTTQAHKLGLTVLHYHFARPGSGHAQAAYFLRAVNPVIGPNDELCIDAEIAGVNGALVDDWLTTIHAAHPDKTLWVYGDEPFLTSNHITPSRGAKLWLAGYVNESELEIPHGWPGWDAWQYTDAATVPGVKGKADMSVLATIKAKGFTHLHAAVLNRATKILDKRGSGKTPLTPQADARVDRLIAAGQKAKAVK